MSELQTLGKRRRRSKTTGHKKARVEDDLEEIQQTKKVGRPKEIRAGVKHHKTKAAETKHANTLKDIMHSMHEHYKSIREFLRAFFTNSHMESAHQNFFQCGGFEEILGLMLESKYVKNGAMAEVIAKYVGDYCAVCTTQRIVA